MSLRDPVLPGMSVLLPRNNLALSAMEAQSINGMPYGPWHRSRSYKGSGIGILAFPTGDHFKYHE